MDDLISRDDIINRTGIAESQFKAFRRYGLVDGYIKKISKVEPDEQKTAEKGKQYFRPAGFDYLYSTSVLKKIKWILSQREKGMNLMQIQSELIRNKIAEEEKIKQQGYKYEKKISCPAMSEGKNHLREKLLKQAIFDLTQRIKSDHPERAVKTLVFLIENQEQNAAANFQPQASVRLDVDTSEF